jgi:hypothetical protein
MRDNGIFIFLAGYKKLLAVSFSFFNRSLLLTLSHPIVQFNLLTRLMAKNSKNGGARIVGKLMLKKSVKSHNK